MVHAGRRAWVRIAGRGCRDKQLLGQNLLHSPDLPVIQPHFDSAGMEKGRGQNIFDHTNGPLAGALIFFQDDLNPRSGMDIASSLAIHPCLCLYAKRAQTDRPRGSFQTKPSDTAAAPAGASRKTKPTFSSCSTIWLPEGLPEFPWMPASRPGILSNLLFLRPGLPPGLPSAMTMRFVCSPCQRFRS
jgi:hypothetical protein